MPRVGFFVSELPNPDIGNRQKTMGKINTIIEKMVNSSGMSISQIIERASLGMHTAIGNQKTELDKSNDHDLHEMVRRCREDIQASEDSGIMPSPRYFEQVAILSRKEKNYKNEIAICEMYIELINDYAAKHKITKDEAAYQVLPKCAPFVKRIQNAKIMSAKS